MFRYSIGEQTDLRVLASHHAGQFFELAKRNEAHLRRWMFWMTENYSPADAREHIEGMLLRFAVSGEFEAGIWWEEKLLGCIRLHSIEWPHRKAEIGYWVDEAAQGLHLASGACRAILHYAFDELQLNRVEIRCAADNARSRRIPERLGFVREGVLRAARRRGEEFVDHLVYGMLAKDWRGL